MLLQMINGFHGAVVTCVFHCCKNNYIYSFCLLELLYSNVFTFIKDLLRTIIDIILVFFFLYFIVRSACFVWD